VLLAAAMVPVCLAQVPGQPAGAPAQAARTALAAGRVVDHSGAGVANAVVWLRTPPPPNAPPPRGPQGDRVATNADGRFAFSGLTAGAYQIDASKPGWLTGAYGRRRPGGNSSSLEIADGERRNDLTITVWRTAVIGGRVADDRGDPLIGAEVRAIRQTYIAGRPQGETPIRVRTDDRGVYRFADLLPGDYIVAVLMNVTSEPATLAGAIRTGAETPRAYLQTMASIGVMPMVFDRATSVTGIDQPLIRTLSDSITAVAPGQPMLAYATTYFPSSSSIRTARVVRAVSGEPQEAIDFTMRLQPTLQVSGVVRDAEGAAAWHAVHLIPADAGDAPLVDVSTAITDGKGAFTLFGVPRGQYIARVVRIPWPGAGRLAMVGGTGAIMSIAALSGPPGPASDESLLHASEPVAVADRDVRNLQLVLKPGARVKGFVQFEGTGAPPDLTRVFLRIEPATGRADASGPSAVLPATFTSDHKFTSEGLLPGRYLIRANAPPGWTFKGATFQGRDVSESPVELTGEIDGVVITYTNRPAEIAGSVTAAAPADPAGALVLLFPADPEAWMDYGRTSRRITSRIVDAKGGFSLTLPPPGEYCLVALADEDSQDWQNPAKLKQLATVAERLRVGTDSISGQSLQLRRLR
jgi:hypothetical protein